MLFIIFGLIEVVQGYKYIRFTMLVTGFFVWGKKKKRDDPCL